MVLDTWNVSVAKIAQTPSADPNADKITANQSKVSSVALEEGIISVTADVDTLEAFPSSIASQGTHKWVGILITTGLPDITAVKYNGTLLSAADIADATSCGGLAGDIVLWLKCDEIADTLKMFTLWASGYGDAIFTVVISPPEE
mgnify:CR=1 FL=1